MTFGDKKVEASDFEMSDAVAQIVTHALEKNAGDLDYSNLVEGTEVPKEFIIAKLEEFAGKSWDDLKAQKEHFSWVTTIQMALHALGYGNEVGPIDGLAGSKYYSAVKDFQRNNKLSIDG